MWSKICHVETFLHMINVETIFFVTIHADLSRNLLCCHLRCIGAKSILSRFTHFCVEKNLTQNYICGEKLTNIRYVYHPCLLCCTFHHVFNYPACQMKHRESETKRCFAAVIILYRHQLCICHQSMPKFNVQWNSCRHNSAETMINFKSN